MYVCNRDYFLVVICRSSVFAIDTLDPIISNLSITQSPGSDNVNIIYDLADNSGSNNTIQLLISSNGGSSWNVATTTLSGDVNSPSLLDLVVPSVGMPVRILAIKKIILCE